VTVRFDGRVALVTGAGTGLGRAYALWMAARGAKLVVNNRVHPDRPSSAAAVVDEIRAGGGEAVADEHSVEDERSGAATVETAVEAFGHLDILVANAGILEFEDHRALKISSIRRTMDINFWGSVYPVVAALPIMEARGYGRVVMTTSSAALYGQTQSAAYAASRAAVIGFARSLAVDTRDSENFRINMILPSAYTNASKAFHDPRFADFMSPAKIAPVTGWLCSEDCRESGLILHAGSGRIRRAKMVEGRAIDLPEDEDVRRCWPALDDMTEAEEAANSSESGNVLRPELYA
jgi:NAD(P)-dependent dehydrogenase (short-subunit alcohol dehydrogenase family)